VLSYRPAVITDVDALSVLVTRVVRRFIVPDCTPEGAARLLESLAPEQFRARLADDYKYYIALYGDFLAGVVGLKGQSHLYHLFVDEDYFGQGLGTKLCTVCMGEAHARFGTTSFTVNSSVFASGFYSKLGFRQAGPLVIHEGIGSVPMRRDL
jgi:GNAT superfamily N-acetyltransferase